MQHIHQRCVQAERETGRGCWQTAHPLSSSQGRSSPTVQDSVAQHAPRYCVGVCAGRALDDGQGVLADGTSFDWQSGEEHGPNAMERWVPRIV